MVARTFESKDDVYKMGNSANIAIKQNSKCSVCTGSQNNLIGHLFDSIDRVNSPVMRQLKID